MPPRKRVIRKKVNEDEPEEEQERDVVSPPQRTRTRSKSFGDNVIHSIEHLREDVIEAVIGTGGEDMYAKVYVCRTEQFAFIFSGLQPIDKAFRSKTYMNILIAIVAIVHFFYVWYYVFKCLKLYYLDSKSPIPAMSDLTAVQRWGIWGSYFLIDIIYPISAAILLRSFLNGKLLLQVSEDLKRDYRGIKGFDKTNKLVEKDYNFYLYYCMLHVIGLLTWLYSKGYDKFDVLFWSCIFGVPHALNPILLTVVIRRIFKFSSARIDYFRQKFNEGQYSTCSMLWDDFIQLRNEIENYGDELGYPLGFFVFSLLGSIIFQGVAVFVFKGEMFSLVYMALNVTCLISVIKEAVNVIKSFNDCCDDIIHSRTTSAVGEIGGLERQNINTVLSREDFSPAFRAFEFRISSSQLIQAVSVSAAAIISVLWETYNFRDFFLGSLNKNDDPSDMNEYIKNVTARLDVLTQALLMNRTQQF